MLGYTARMQTAQTADELHRLMREGADASLLYLTVDDAALPEALPGWRADGPRYRDRRYGGMFAMLYIHDARAHQRHRAVDAMRPPVRVVRQWRWAPWGQPIAYTTYVIG